jgi:prolyl-tRNA editing enzyme YbaK/EbsC (Cys-tRNA(Pro) deacylase)
MSLLDKEPVKRAEKFLKNFDQSLEVIVLENSARTAQDAATALECDVGAIVKSLLFKAENGFYIMFSSR